MRSNESSSFQRGGGGGGGFNQMSSNEAFAKGVAGRNLFSTLAHGPVDPSRPALVYDLLLWLFLFYGYRTLHIIFLSRFICID